MNTALIQAAREAEALNQPIHRKSCGCIPCRKQNGGVPRDTAELMATLKADEPACEHCRDTQEIDGEACGWCCDVAYTSKPARAKTTDITPESLKTAEGAAKVETALAAWQHTQADLANAAARFVAKNNGIQLRTGLHHIADDWQELREMAAEMATQQNAFLRALAGR